MPRYDIVMGKVSAPDAPLNPCAACEVREIALCGALRDDELGRLNQLVASVDVDAQQTIFYEGDPADHVFNVTKGAVRVSKLLPDGRRQITGFLYPGDFLGLAYDATYIYTAEAIAPSRLCRFTRPDLERLLEEFPRLEKRLLGMASNELATAQDQMLLLGRKTAREKIASFLLTLARRAVGRGQDDNPVELPMTRADIADYLGLTIETVSRTFTELRKGSYIELAEAHTVTLLQPAALEDMAGE